jgi:hypothetical protein
MAGVSHQALCTEPDLHSELQGGLMHELSPPGKSIVATQLVTQVEGNELQRDTRPAVIGWQAELALCDWLAEPHDLIWRDCICPSSSFVSRQLGGGFAGGRRGVCRTPEGGGGGAVRRRSYSPFWSEVFCGVALNRVS